VAESPHGPAPSPGGYDPFDAAFSTLADEHRRDVLRYFSQSGATVASVDDLVDHAVERDGTPRERDHVRLAFRHATLPRLAESGVVEYDERSGTVRYRADPTIERLLGLVVELEPTA